MNQYFIYAVIIVGIFTIYMALVNIFKRDRMSERLRTAIPDEHDDDDLPPFAAFCNMALSLFKIDVTQQKELTTELWRAGITSPYAVSYYLFFKKFIQPILFLIGIAALSRLMLVSGLPTIEKIFHIALGGFLLVLGLSGTKIYIANLRQRRQKILLLDFPEALDLLLVCIESGLGLDAALARVCKEMRDTHPVVISELDRTRIELTVMSDRSQALENLAERTGITQFKSLVAALIQTEKFGTSLLDTLRVLSDDIRNTRLMNAENRAARIPVIITIPLIFCMLPAFIMIILGPPIIKVMEQGGIFGEQHTKKD